MPIRLRGFKSGQYGCSKFVAAAMTAGVILLLISIVHYEYTGSYSRILMEINSVIGAKGLKTKKGSFEKNIKNSKEQKELACSKRSFF